MDYIEEGRKQGLISLSEDGKKISYLHQGKSRNFSNPEEQIQAETFLKLVIDLQYPVEHIEQFVTITMGAEKKEADIVVYDSSKKDKPIIVVECKKQEVTQQEFEQAKEQAYSYAAALSGTVKYVWTTSGLIDDFFKFDKERKTREALTAIPMYGTDKVAPYNYVNGGGKHEYTQGGKKYTQRFKDIQTVSEHELTRRFKQAHDALWAGGQLNPSEAFDELDKLIFCKIWDEKYDVKNGKLKPRKKGQIYDFQVILEEGKDENDARRKTNAKLAERIKAVYEAGKNFDKEVFKDDIRLSDERIRTIVGYLQDISLNSTDLDSKGRAFETFMGNFFRGEFGQYFTPRVIVQFIVEALPIDNHSYVLDTSCGSGGFLLHALDKVRRQANEEYPEHKTDPEQKLLHHKFWHDFAEKRLFGIEINEQIARAAKMNMIIHDDGHTNVVSVDGLISDEDVRFQTNNNDFKYGTFDHIITNPPFGSSVKKSEKNYLKNFTFGSKESDWLDIKKSKSSSRNKQNTEVLFIEQCHKYLKDDGYLAVVIPDGILTNSSLQYVRDSIEDWFRIISVISLPQTAFSATGAGVKSSVLILRKYSNKHSTFLIDTKREIQEDLKIKFEYLKKHSEYNIARKKAIKQMTGFVNNSNESSLSEIKKTKSYIDWKEQTSSIYSDKISELKEGLEIAYQKERSNQLPDYCIFMAIAENIGYDAVGKSTSEIIENTETKFTSFKVIRQHHRHDLFDELIERKIDLQGELIETKKEILPRNILGELQRFIKEIDNGK